jgi:hypothetical protein
MCISSEDTPNACTRRYQKLRRNILEFGEVRKPSEVQLWIHDFSCCVSAVRDISEALRRHVPGQGLICESMLTLDVCHRSTKAGDADKLKPAYTKMAVKVAGGRDRVPSLSDPGTLRLFIGCSKR